jgi:predicted alpha/beta hydrolase family esterase
MNAIILHSWYGDIEKDWCHWIIQELSSRKIPVFIKQIPTFDTNLPDLEISLKFIKENSEINDQTIVIGHSLGCLLALRLAEQKTFKKMVLVAGWDFNDLTAEHRLFWPNMINHGKIKQNVKEIVCVSSDNDPYITACQAEDMSKRLNGKFVLVPGAGHFTEKYGVTKIPEIIQYL